MLEPTDLRLRHALQQMCVSMPGGWPTMAAALGMSVSALENRIYERHGQSPSVHLVRQMQIISATSLFAEAFAADSGGVFVPLPAVDKLGNEDIQSLYMALVEEVGDLAHEWRESTRDGEVDSRERAQLERIRDGICQRVTQINDLTFKLFCRSKA